MLMGTLIAGVAGSLPIRERLADWIAALWNSGVRPSMVSSMAWMLPAANVPVLGCAVSQGISHRGKSEPWPELGAQSAGP